MKVLVTGANGFLASNIIRELIRRGHQVSGLVRKTADLRPLEGLNVDLVYGDLTDSLDVQHAVKGCDRVIHAAANTSQQQVNYSSFESANVLGTMNVLDACVRFATERLIFVSTANTLGFGSKENPGDENCKASPVFLRSFYARSKYEAQRLVLKYVADKHLDAIVVNPTFMLGPYDVKPGSGKIILMHHLKHHAFVPRGGKNFVHVGDVAAAVCNAMQHGRKGHCYLAGGENLMYKEFLLLQAAVTRYPIHIHELPDSLVRTAGMAGSVWSGLGFSTNLNWRNARLVCIGNYYDPAKAINELQMPQTPVRQAIADAFTWYGSQGMLPGQ